MFRSRFVLFSIVGQCCIVLTANEIASAATQVTGATINGSAGPITVSPNGVITAEVSVTNGNGSNNWWESTRYTISGQAAVCLDVPSPDFRTNSSSTSRSFQLSAPSTPGSYSISFQAFTGDICGANSSNIVTLTNAIIVCIDDDNDGTCNADDACPNDPNKTSPGQCGCGVADTDSDGDGMADCNDGCPIDPNKFAPGQCGCGNPDTDTDGDGTLDCHDGCPNDSNKITPGECGCGTPDLDSDGDGTPDCLDSCPNDPLKTAAGTCGCGVQDLDGDNDSWADCIDNCVNVGNADQSDADLDNIGDACDNCPHRHNADQLDSNSNGRGDACDLPTPSAAAVASDPGPPVRPVRKQPSALDQGSQPCGVGTGLGVAGVTLGLMGARGRRRRFV